ncbi:MAG: flagellar assembly protein FliW [Lachnospiraceae bacterium]|nr:flagellar assembly protein FliW [Lachnospiraceae bacterium]
MVITTKVFGEIEIDDAKIITFEGGIIGFPDLKRFTLLYDSEKTGGIKWLQSLDEPAFAMPVMDPLAVKETYNPVVEDELLKPLGELDPEEILVLVTVTVPSDLTKMSVNLQAPLVINAENKKGCQIIVDNEGGEFPVKFMVYDILQKKKERAGE